MFNMWNHKCVLCVLIPIWLSGIVGFWAGNISLDFGLSAAASSSIAGFSGFMAAQSFNFACLLLTTRYRQKKRSKTNDD